VFTQFESATSTQLRSWQEHVRQVAGSLPVTVGAADNDTPVIVWSLYSANNRDLGHGARIYQRFEEAAMDARVVIVEQSRLELRMLRGDRDRAYGWSLTDDRRVEMVCPRWYQTVRERRYAISLAMTALPIASVSDRAHLARSSFKAGERKHPSR
jgi:hypothetical protein